MKTLSQILLEVQVHKPCTRTALYTYFKRLGIKPIGARQRPQLYPDEAGGMIIGHLFSAQIVSMKQLRSERAKAKAARGRK
jgi:hypothetical protein